MGGVSAILSILIFSTTTGLLALDTADQWANNVGIVGSAVLSTVLVVWVLRKGPKLRFHLDAVSTFKVGKVWVFLVGVLAPVVLAYMLISRIITLIVDGYADLPGWYLGILGWGTIAFIVGAVIVFTMLRWKRDPDDFTAWPEYAVGSRRRSAHDRHRHQLPAARARCWSGAASSPASSSCVRAPCSTRTPRRGHRRPLRGRGPVHSGHLIR